MVSGCGYLFFSLLPHVLLTLDIRAPDMEGRYAVAHAGGLIRVGNTREFVLRSTALKG